MDKVSHKTCRPILEREFAALGFSIIFFNEKPESNGPDLWVIKKGKRPLSVEIKMLRKQQNGMHQVDPVSESRKSDDLIAIIFNSEYVLIEPMSDHLKCCSPKGTRQFTLMR